MGIEPQKITSVNAFVDAISSLRQAQSADNAQQWFFRGQKNSNWDIRPNLFRGDDLAAEHIFIERALRQNPTEFHDCNSSFEILTKLQHYGLGTRLLDVTLNPLVALFFATEHSCEYCKNQNGQYSLKEHDGIIYYRFVNGGALRDIQIRIALVIPFVEFGKSMSLEVFCKNVKDDGVISESEYNQLIDNDYEMILNILQTNNFIVAANSNARLRQQRGAFLVSPSVNIKTNNDTGKSLLSKAKSNLEREFEGCYIIPERNKNEIREELDFFNVNEATLFPEFEHQMYYIQGQSNSRVGTVEEYKQYARVARGNIISYDRSPPDVNRIIRNILPMISEKNTLLLEKEIIATIDTIDWYMKESVISKLRRVIKRNISSIDPTIDAESKSNELVEELLK